LPNNDPSDTRLAVAGKKDAAARRHLVTAEVYRREAAAIRAEVEAEQKQERRAAS
jgi:hypothetical protein